MADAGLAPAMGDTRAISQGRMILLFMVMLVTAAGNTAMQSVMPSIGTELGVADVWISAAYTWSALLWVICAPIWARRSDRRGRKAMMALGLIGFIVSMALCGIVLLFGLSGALSATMTLIFFAAARSLYGGFGSAAPPAVQAYVASRTPRSERTKALSLIASSFGLGTVIGPALAPLLVFDRPGPFALGLVGPFVIFAAIGVAVLVALRMRLPDDDPAFQARGEIVTAPFSANASTRYLASDEPDIAAGSAPAKVAKADDIPDLRWTDKRLRSWLVAGLLGGHAQAALFGVVGFLILDRLGLRATPDEATGPIGIVLMAGAIATLLSQWGLIPMLNLGPRNATLWGSALAFIGTIVVGAGSQLHTIALGMSIAALGFGLFRPGFTSGASLSVTRKEQGQVSGIVASINGAAYILAPSLGVLVYGFDAWLGFGLIAVLALSVFVMGWRSLASDSELAIQPD
ncbi:MFS transporter [Alteripontixanthobacter maritimus]|nr:MFS transporter [Alteripontixanthobacter maritimus]